MPFLLTVQSAVARLNLRYRHPSDSETTSENISLFPRKIHRATDRAIESVISCIPVHFGRHLRIEEALNLATDEALKALYLKGFIGGEGGI